MGDLGVVWALEGGVWFFAMGWNGKRGFGGGDFVNGGNKLEEETNWDEEGARIGVLMGEKKKQREGGESVKMGENGMEGAWSL
ncbi:hypothetical protein [Bartonella raoultii]|uniref:hypothetical protein n=1 Tax=Bartonella raoultii TaxID=1457020 RepID=UPI001ABA86A4|nr:hypothetical protein [Bartonella raoultii]